MNINFLEIAQIELDDAIEYYNYEVPGLGDAFLTEVLMRWIGLANFLKHGILVQNEQGDVKPGVFHMELFTKHENKKSWLWQSQIFTESLTIGRTEYKMAEHQLGEGCSFRCAPFTPLKLVRLNISAGVFRET